MDLQAWTEFLLWCAAINCAVLVFRFLVFAFARGGLRGLHGRWFRLGEEAFDAIHHALMETFRLGIPLLNLAPRLALEAIA